MTDLDEDPSMYTASQEKLLFWIGKPNLVIGILGSVYICYCIARDVKRRQQTFRRLLFSVSAGHILLVLCTALLTIPMPRGTHYASFGNEQTCIAMGFVTHWAFGFCLFGHAAMGFYYIFTFFRGWTERQFQQKIEPILHATAILFPLLSAIIGISMGMYGPNEMLLQCWVATGVPGRNYFTLFSGLIELNYFTIFKQLSLFGIARTVYKQERRMVLRYSVGASTSITGVGTNSNARASVPQSVLLARSTIIQATIFYLSCFIPYAPMIMMRWVDLFWVNIPDDGKVPQSLFTLAAVAHFLYPLQGLVATVGFMRPDYLKIRKECHDETASFADLLWRTVLFQTGWGEANSLDQSAASAQGRNGSILKTIQKEFIKQLQNRSNRDSNTTMSSTSHHDGRDSLPFASEGSPEQPEDVSAMAAEASSGTGALWSTPRRSVAVHTLSGFLDFDWSSDDESDCDQEEDLAFEKEDKELSA